MQDPETIAAIEKLLDPNKPKPKVLYTYWLVAEEGSVEMTQPPEFKFKETGEVVPGQIYCLEINRENPAESVKDFVNATIKVIEAAQKG
jgi:hypothetical protein